MQCHEQPDAFQVHIDKKLYPWKLLSCQEFRADKEMEEQENKMVDTWIQQALSSCESHKELGGARKNKMIGTKIQQLYPCNWPAHKESVGAK